MKWYKRDPEAFKVGTMGLTLEECGFYTTILDLMYSTDDHCPNDDRFLSRLLLGTNVRTVRRLKGRLIELGKLRIGSDGFLHNGRVSSEIAEWQHRMELRRARMAKVSGKFEPSLGAVSGMFGDNVTEKSNEINETILKSDRTTTTTTKISKKDKGPPRKKAKREFQEGWLPRIPLTSNNATMFEAFCDDAMAHGRVYADWDRAWSGWQRRQPQFERRSGNGTNRQDGNGVGSIRAALDQHGENIRREVERSAGVYPHPTRLLRQN
jgi:uncharacterized protein YdaU (DUF1376 family)